MTHAVLTGLCFISSLSFGQPVSIGVKGGVPLTDAFFRRAREQFLLREQHETLYGRSDGGISSPARFSIEIDALYTRPPRLRQHHDHQ